MWRSNWNIVRILNYPSVWNSRANTKKWYIEQWVTIKCIAKWPTVKHELITKHLEPLLTYIESIDFALL
jgi:hypothetical protein